LDQTASLAPTDRPFDLLRDNLERLRDRLRIAVIFNGDRHAPGAVVHPTHNPRSEKSYRAVAEDIAEGLRNAGFRQVRLLPDDLTLVDALRTGAVDIAWLNTAGVQGYDAVAHTPAILELAGIPYVGHRPLLAVTLDNKHVFKRELAGLQLPTAPFMVWDGIRGALDPAHNPLFQATFGDHPGPFVVKPVSGRASLHVTFVPDRSALAAAVHDVYAATLNLVQIETYLPGPEYCVSVCGRVVARGGWIERGEQPFVFSILERRLAADEPIFTSMDLKPITAARTRTMTRATDGPVFDALEGLARQVYYDFHLRTLIRLDIRADAAGRLHILEANPKPDLARPRDGRLSLVCAALDQHGMTYDDLILSLIADRLDFYLRHRPAAVRHILDRVA